MKFSAIVRRTTKRRKQSARYVRFLQAKKGYTREGYGFLAVQSNSTHAYDPATKTYIPTPNKPKYVTVVTVLDDDLNCVVSCSCKDFLYRWEVALYLEDAADIEYSNGELPEITNPQLAPRCCKHLVRLYAAIGKQMGTLRPRKPQRRKKR